MIDRRVIILVFAGRAPNMALQVPMVQRILSQYANVEYHVINLARNKSDAMAVRMIAGEQIVLRDDFYRRRFPYVYAHYSKPAYEDCLFVKLDDDIVFLETERFSAFVDAINDRSAAGGIVSAATINNGACTKSFPKLWKQFQDLEIPLLDVHKSNAYAQLCHQFFIEQHAELLNAPIGVTPTKDWLSINCVGFDHATLQAITASLGQPSPPRIAGRTFAEYDLLGDEGAANLLPRFIEHGFTAAHLGYGPQKLTHEQAEATREAYRVIGRDYLALASLVTA